MPNGTVAVQSALRLLNLPRGTLVAVPSWCCWKVAFAVESEGHTVVEVAYDEDLQPRVDSVDPAVRSAVAVAILVHYVGWPCSLARLRAAFAEALVIEDCAQAWRLQRDGRAMGEGADLVITSMGPGKALELGHYGAVLYRDETHRERFNMDGWPHERAPIPFAVSAPEHQPLALATGLADERLRKRRARAQVAALSLERIGATPLRCPKGGEPTWMRLPVACRSDNDAAVLAAALAREGVPWQRPWRRRVSESDAGTRCLDSRVLLVDIREPHLWWSRRDRVSRSD